MIRFRLPHQRFSLPIYLGVLFLCAGRSNAADTSTTAKAIDRAIQQELDARKIPASPRVDDAEFLRRVSLDIIGQIPSPERASAFLDSKEPDKRSKLIDELLANSLYGEHVAGIWTDRINANGTPPRSVTSAFRKWLASEFNEGRGWDKTVHEMLTVGGGAYEKPSGYFIRANYKEPGLLADTTARFFLGIRLQCAECHDHPFNNWTQNDYWGMAAFFSRVKQINGGKGGNLLTEDTLPGKKAPAPGSGGSITIPNAGGNKSAGKVVKAKFLSGKQPTMPDEGPLRPALADWVTAKDNPYFAPAAVNRLWGHFFGASFVNPFDDFQEGVESSHPELLRLLSKEFITSGHDFKHLIRCICNSDTYQRTSKPLPGNKDDQTLFSHMAVKVMSADVLFDSLVVAMGNPKMSGGLGSPLPYEVYAEKTSRASKPQAREEFLKFFDTRDDSSKSTEYTHGIPQVLALLNAKQFNTTTPLVEKLVKAGATKEKAIETLFLATLTRRPTENEAKLMIVYLEKCKDLKEGLSGILWILFNTNEFVLNH